MGENLHLVIVTILLVLVVGDFLYLIIRGIVYILREIYDFFDYFLYETKERIEKIKEFIKKKRKLTPEKLLEEQRRKKLEEIAYFERKITEIKNAILVVEMDISKLKSDYPEVFKYGNPYEYFDSGFDSQNMYGALEFRKNMLEKELQKYENNLSALKSYWESNDWKNTEI